MRDREPALTMTDVAQPNADLLLELRGASRSFGSGATLVSAVAGVDLTVRRGEVLLVMGPSGSGKTTLLSLIGGLLRPTSGTIRLAEFELSTMSESDRIRVRRENIGFVFQDFNLLSSLTAQENVEVALNLCGVRGVMAHERSAKLLTQLGMGARLDFPPSKLSGGEKQRVAIARALANDPLLILADEPTANLDSVHGMAVVQLLTGIAQREGRTVIIVSHDDRLRDIATRIVWMEDGRINERSNDAAGSPSELEQFNVAETRV